MSEMITEECPDCGWERDREWITKTSIPGNKRPPGHQVIRRSKSWVTYRAPTNWTTLCACDI